MILDQLEGDTVDGGNLRLAAGYRFDAGQVAACVQNLVEETATGAEPGQFIT